MFASKKRGEKNMNRKLNLAIITIRNIKIRKMLMANFNNFIQEKENMKFFLSKKKKKKAYLLMFNAVIVFSFKENVKIQSINFNHFLFLFLLSYKQ